ncbi:MAG: EAL domain-containing protein [Acidimicrobiales bacterium]
MGTTGGEGQRRERRVLRVVGGTAVAGSAVALLAVLQAPSRSVGPLAFVVLVTGALVWSQLSPTFLAWRGEGNETTLDEAILIVGFVLMPTTGVLLASAAATLTTHLIRRRPLRKLVFNVGASLFGTALAALVINATVGTVDGVLTTSHLLAVTVGATVFWAAQALLVWLVIAYASGTSFVTVLSQSLSPATLSFVVTGSWGLLMAIAVQHLRWSIVLGAAPFILLRALYRAEGERGRLKSLLHTAAAAATATTQSRGSVQASVEESACELLAAGRATVRSAPPAPGELGAPLSGTDPGWLVVGGRHSANPFAPQDRDLLEGIAAVASIALQNADMIDRLGHAALHDPLTALPNRLLFTTRVAAAIERCTAEGTRFGVLSIDLDRFKRINDNLGHLAGDELLRQVASRLDAVVAPEDTVCRMGGDELAVIVAGHGSVEHLTASAERVLAGMARPFDLNGSHVFVTASVGIARFPVDGDTPELLLRAADRALYAAKDAGRNGLVVHHHGDDAIGDLALEQDLHVAIERQQLWVAYQPVVGSDGGARSVEALVRWDHPELGSVPPDRFLRVAEELGLVASIDRWVLDQAVSQLGRWGASGLGHVRIAVNVSARTLSEVGFEVHVAETLARHDIPAHRLELEITEQTAVQEPLAVVDRLRQLRETGVTIAIDDFGTGYSSLSRLHDFPADRLKVDRSFVSTLAAGEHNAIVAATIAMAHHLGLEVVAEGVETEEQLDILRELRCDAAQGWLFARALRPDEAAAELRLRLPREATTPPRLALSR